MRSQNKPDIVFGCAIHILQIKFAVNNIVSCELIYSVAIFWYIDIHRTA